MAIIWKPDGQLDIATDPASLPMTLSSELTTTLSDALTRCKNMRTNQAGQLKTRDGSVKLNEVALAGPDKNIVINGDFVTDLSSWTAGASNIWVAGRLRKVLGGGNTSQIVTLIVGNSYKLEATFYHVGLGQPRIKLAAGTSAGLSDIAIVNGQPASEGDSVTVNVTFTAPQTSISVTIIGDTGATGDVDNVSLVNVGTAEKTPIWLLIEMVGNRYAFAGDSIYKNEVSLASELAQAQWSGIRYNSFNDKQLDILCNQWNLAHTLKSYLLRKTQCLDVTNGDHPDQHINPRCAASIGYREPLIYCPLCKSHGNSSQGNFKKSEMDFCMVANNIVEPTNANYPLV